MDEQIEQKIPKKINRHEFYFETPLYDFISKEDLEEKILEGDVDAYSSKNGIDTTYEIYARLIDATYESSSFNNYYKITLTCKRKRDDVLKFFVYSDTHVIVKVGQFPSLADIQFAEIGKKYDKLLSKEALKEFKRAIGLTSHGVGVGSFVYLRRIFENLIYESFDEHQEEIDITKEQFTTIRMEEKIDVLKKYLPSQLISMKSVYSILSKGIHQLTEEVCLSYFPALKLSIELVLDQKIEMEIKKQRDEEVKKQIDDINQEIANNN